MENSICTKREWHKKQAIENFNDCWDLIEKTDRSQDDDLRMIHTAHASRFHWGEVGTPVEFARGEWQISRVYSLLGMFESALYHATVSLNFCKENNIRDFDLAFAYEAIARAHSIGNNLELQKKYRRLADQSAKDIEKESDRNYFLSELQQL